jgi:hypothetical protein
MIYGTIIIFLAIGYHTFTYGIYILKNERSKLPAFAVFALAIIATVAPITALFTRY